MRLLTWKSAIWKVEDKQTSAKSNKLIIFIYDYKS